MCLCVTDHPGFGCGYLECHTANRCGAMRVIQSTVVTVEAGAGAATEANAKAKAKGMAKAFIVLPQAAVQGSSAGSGYAFVYQWRFH